MRRKSRRITPAPEATPEAAPVAPVNLSTQAVAAEQQLRNALATQQGPGYEQGTPGLTALSEFKKTQENIQALPQAEAVQEAQQEMARIPTQVPQDIPSIASITPQQSLITLARMKRYYESLPKGTPQRFSLGRGGVTQA